MPRTIHRTPKDREHPFVQIDNRAVEDAELSWRARGILAYLLSKPDDWQIRVGDLVRHGVDGEQSARSGLRELATRGYLRRRRLRDPDTGRYARYVYTIQEVPDLADTPITKQTHPAKPAKPDAGAPDGAPPRRAKPDVAKPDAAGPDQGGPPPTNTDGTKTNLTKDDVDPPCSPPAPLTAAPSRTTRPDAPSRAAPSAAPPRAAPRGLLSAGSGTTVPPTADPVLAEVVRLYEQEIPGTLTAMTLDELTDLTSACRDLDRWRHALRASVGAQNRWRYAKAIILSNGKHPPKEEADGTQPRRSHGHDPGAWTPRGPHGRRFSRPAPAELARIRHEALAALAAEDGHD